MREAYARPLTAYRNRSRNRTWTHSDWHRQGLKGVHRFRWTARGILLLHLTFLKKAPAGGSHDESTGHSHDRQGDAEELKNIGAQEQRAEQHEEAAAGHPQGERIAFLIGTVSGQCKKNRSAADWIHNWEQSGVDEKKSSREILQGHSASILRSVELCNRQYLGCLSEHGCVG